MTLYGDHMASMIRWGMRIGRGNRNTRRKPVRMSLCPPQIPNYLTCDWTWSATVKSLLSAMPWRHTGECRYSPTILLVGTVSFTPLPLYPRYPLDRRLGGSQIRPGSCREEKNLALPGIEPGLSSP
jgi:hypothetical protein